MNLGHNEEVRSVEADLTPSDKGSVTGKIVNSDLDLYQQNICPPTQQIRYQKLDEICKMIVQKGANSNDHLYRLAVMKCNQVLTELEMQTIIHYEVRAIRY